MRDLLIAAVPLAEDDTVDTGQTQQQRRLQGVLSFTGEDRDSEL